MPDLVNLPGDGGKWGLCYTRRKRSRDATPLFRAEKKQQPEPRSLDALPDECLYEILRRLPGNRERSISACVSKRWLMLLSVIRPPELSLEEESLKSMFWSRFLVGRMVTDVGAAAVAVGTAGRGGLDKLEIQGSHENPGITDVGLSAVARCCTSLKVLSVWRLSNITDAGLSELARGCPMIENLELCGCPLITGKGLLAVAEKFPNLVSIILQSCVSIGDEGIHAIGCCRPKLQSVQIEDCPLIGDQGIAAIMCSASSSLATLKLQNLNVSDLAFECIGHKGKAVTNMYLSGLQSVPGRGFWRMGSAMSLQKLESITVTACHGVTVRGLAAMAKGCPSLKQLSLCRCHHVSDAGLKAFVESARALEILQLEECDGITLAGFLASLVNRKIKTLGLVKCLGIKDIGSCSDESADASLVDVNLQGCANIVDSAICALVQQHGETLQVLNLFGCNKLTDRALLAISEHCKVLEVLDMFGSDITDYGVALLASARHLNVRDISFAGCHKLTPRCLPLFCNMGRSLVHLDIYYCNLISDLDISSLEKTMWWCRMEWD